MIRRRHCVFTIDDDLRDFLLIDRSLLDCLFSATRSVILRMFFNLGRPVIATSRIDSYDGSFVTFHYNRHEDNRLIHETIPTMEFIMRLIRHIPEKHFKMLRYGGLYARYRKTAQHLQRAIFKEKHYVFRIFNQWRTAILSAFGYDPPECPVCKHKMKFLELFFNNKRGRASGYGLFS